ncbi:MAG: hypothetical protein L6Q37_14605 [Bdellovibrionaceae bacterium]|nr:hypothetical protein [Pseudobdellovibrionaceae bacterium]NUM59512.1 hypothetical protein [Pseudobdellovibrionaceae bacterium]
MKSLPIYKVYIIFPTPSLSGLVNYDQKLWGVSDENYKLYEINLDSVKEYCFDQNLQVHLESMEYKQKKKVKPDFESISLFKRWNKEYFFLLGSFSGELRNKLYFLDMPSLILSAVFEAQIMSTTVLNKPTNFNIEGHFFKEQQLYLLNRGNEHSSSSLISLSDFENKLNFQMNKNSSAVISKKIELSINTITDVFIGEFEGYQIHWTEALLKNQKEIYFLATVEKTTNSFDDGQVLASFVGLFDIENLNVLRMYKILDGEKAEGMAILGDRMYFCIDTDNPHRFSELFYFEMDDFYK